MIGVAGNGRIRVAAVVGELRGYPGVGSVHRTRVHHFRRCRNGNEPEAKQQASDAAPDRAPHTLNDWDRASQTQEASRALRGEQW